MKLATPKSDKWRVTSGKKKNSAHAGISRHLSLVTCHTSAFTLAEVLAAMLLLAIVIPAAVEALHVASLAGEVAARKGAAARVADRVLNESLVMTNWNSGVQSGTVSEGALDFRWTLTSQAWPQDSMQLLTAEVKYQAQGKDFSVKLSTLANAQTQPAQPQTTTAMNLRQ
jgi:type II secretory pathway pseudopilin PulG